MHCLENLGEVEASAHNQTIRVYLEGKLTLWACSHYSLKSSILCSPLSTVRKDHHDKVKSHKEGNEISGCFWVQRLQLLTLFFSAWMTCLHLPYRQYFCLGSLAGWNHHDSAPAWLGMGCLNSPFLQDPAARFDSKFDPWTIFLSWLGKLSGTMEEFSKSSGHCADLLSHDAVTCSALVENHFTKVILLTAARQHSKWQSRRKMMGMLYQELV